MSIVTAWNDGKLRAYLPESGRLIYDVPHAHHLDATAVVITDCNRFVIIVFLPEFYFEFQKNNFRWCRRSNSCLEYQFFKQKQANRFAFGNNERT